MLMFMILNLRVQLELIKRISSVGVDASIVITIVIIIIAIIVIIIE